MKLLVLIYVTIDEVYLSKVVNVVVYYSFNPGSIIVRYL